jgi:hypothetical protein
MAYTDQKSPHLTHVSDIFGFSMENYAIYNVAVLSWVPLSGELLLLYKTRLCVAFFFTIGLMSFPDVGPKISGTAGTISPILQHITL